MMEVVSGDNWSYRRAKFQSNCHHQQTNTQLFTGRMPFLSANQWYQSIEGEDSLTWLNQNCFNINKTCYTWYRGSGVLASEGWWEAWQPSPR